MTTQSPNVQRASHSIEDTAALRAIPLSVPSDDAVTGSVFKTDAPIRLKAPTVLLETSPVSQSLAATLAMSLLGHTMFQKGQIPLPVVQLARMPGRQTDSKAAKKRMELLSAIDTLSSHMQTTFLALSTAIARRKQKDDGGNENLIKHGRAHLAFMVGPSAGAARARVMLVIDGLELKIWGEEAPAGYERAIAEEQQDRVEMPLESTEDQRGTQNHYNSGGNGLSSEDSDSDDESDLEEPNSFATEAATEPPLSPSPSPSPPPSQDVSRSPSPEPASTSKFQVYRDLEQPPPPVGFASVTPPRRTVFRPFCDPSPPSQQPAQVSKSPALKPVCDTPPSSGASPLAKDVDGQTRSLPLRDRTPVVQGQGLKTAQVRQDESFAGEQQALQAASRLLSRTLINACAEDDGGMSCELAPTQTHVMLRAPRRFSHPAWIPKQNLTRTMEKTLETFLKDAKGDGPSKSEVISKKMKTEGVFVGHRGSDWHAVTSMQTRENDEPGSDEEDCRFEDDEMIWWAWDGKLVGFTDW
ncbi:hypothetical protein WOLCODRAFT_163336 [Wolfiporia cocos MD-104 SS10]|uniref:Uncharacterized protein n=1 Tax=Wolfiporia cocos (strain MD-104) TaxID=742152 RepID=A0A2H3JZX5_WOLCO|nr:hypothetical protein WOLCODRAFT_163336 [Wolfiporia cocos MD-104 SS10]